MTQIKKKELVDFLLSCKGKEIGVHKGKRTAIYEEMEVLARWIRRAEMLSNGASYYRSYAVYSFVEYTEEERMKERDAVLRRACSKILWLNRLSVKATGSPFVAGAVNKECMDDVKNVVYAFEEAMISFLPL